MLTNDVPMRNLSSYDIFELPDYSIVTLIGTNDDVEIIPVLKIRRNSISAGIFESKLAMAAVCQCLNGNTYKVSFSNITLYVHINGEFINVGSIYTGTNSRSLCNL